MGNRGEKRKENVIFVGRKLHFVYHSYLLRHFLSFIRVFDLIKIVTFRAETRNILVRTQKIVIFWSENQNFLVKKLLFMEEGEIGKSQGGQHYWDNFLSEIGIMYQSMALVAGPMATKWMETNCVLLMSRELMMRTKKIGLKMGNYCGKIRKDNFLLFYPILPFTSTIFPFFF